MSTATPLTGPAVDADASPDGAQDLAADLVIIGAGPAGLYGAYYAGVRGLSTIVIDSLPEAGGQVAALYPEKTIYDVAGFPAVTGRELIDRCLAQAEPFAPTYLLDHRAEDLGADGDGGFLVRTHRDARVRARAIVITGGIGTFRPRPLPGGEGWEGRGLLYFVRELEPLRGQDVVIVGGGDSALDWALTLEPMARSVTLVHRRDAFRAHEDSVVRLRASSVRVITPAQVVAVEGGERVERIVVQRSDAAAGDAPLVLPCDTVVAALGFTSDLGPLRSWDVATDGRGILVDSGCRTSVPGIYAAGDITEYDGKVRLISVGFGEAATAVNNAAAWIDPGAKVFPGHSSG
jgi:ferredoxin/flavodoxin---NADP+ reductase